jgi:hypothetical protein
MLATIMDRTTSRTSDSLCFNVIPSLSGFEAYDLKLATLPPAGGKHVSRRVAACDGLSDVTAPEVVRNWQ